MTQKHDDKMILPGTRLERLKFYLFGGTMEYLRPYREEHRHGVIISRPIWSRLYYRFLYREPKSSYPNGECQSEALSQNEIGVRDG